MEWEYMVATVPRFCKSIASGSVLIERTVDGESASTGQSPLNMVFIIAFALGISYLAMRLARRGGRRK